MTKLDMIILEIWIDCMRKDCFEFLLIHHPRSGFYPSNDLGLGFTPRWWHLLLLRHLARAGAFLLCRCLGGGEESVSDGDMRLGRWGETRGLGGKMRWDPDLGWRLQLGSGGWWAVGEWHGDIGCRWAADKFDGHILLFLFSIFLFIVFFFMWSYANALF